MRPNILYGMFGLEAAPKKFWLSRRLWLEKPNSVGKPIEYVVSVGLDHNSFASFIDLAGKDVVLLPILGLSKSHIIY